MNDAEVQCLKDCIDKVVEIETIDGEQLVARVISVFSDAEYDEHELFYEMLSTNMPEAYKHLGNAGGYALDFGKIASVRPSSCCEPTTKASS
jgi:hypothetical protein